MFVPAIVRAVKGYQRADFAADLGAGVTVGMIALPLAIGFGIASGVTPQQGLWTGIIASVAVALFGGSRFQIAGPTGAFVPVLFSIVAIYGYNGLALATLMAGVMLVLIGALRMGRLLKFIPYPVVAGFTSGIALIIFCGQLNEFLGLGLKMPGHAPQQIAVLAHNIHLLNLRTLAIGALTLVVFYFWPRLTKRIPASIVAVACATAAAYFAGWPVATIGTRFGGITADFPGFHFPTISLPLMRDLMGPAFTIAALGAIESLLSAMVADGITDTRHNPNQELIGQGIANLLCPLAGGICRDRRDRAHSREHPERSSHPGSRDHPRLRPARRPFSSPDHSLATSRSPRSAPSFSPSPSAWRSGTPSSNSGAARAPTLASWSQLSR